MGGFHVTVFVIHCLEEGSRPLVVEPVPVAIADEELFTRLNRAGGDHNYAVPAKGEATILLLFGVRLVQSPRRAGVDSPGVVSDVSSLWVREGNHVFPRGGGRFGWVTDGVAISQCILHYYK
jgi:hypothetical protein